MSKQSVAVTISGQEYRIRGDENDVLLQQAAAYVDAVMSRIRERTGTVDSHDVAVLTALNLSHELLAHRQRSQGGEADSRETQDRIAALAARAEELLDSLTPVAEVAGASSA